MLMARKGGLDEVDILEYETSDLMLAMCILDGVEMRHEHIQTALRWVHEVVTLMVGSPYEPKRTGMVVVYLNQRTYLRKILPSALS